MSLLDIPARHLRLRWVAKVTCRLQGPSVAHDKGIQGLKYKDYKVLASVVGALCVLLNV